MPQYCYLCSDDAENVKFPPADDDYINIHHKCFRNFISSNTLSSLGDRVFSIEHNKSSNYYLEVLNITTNVLPFIPLESQKEYMCNEIVLYNGMYLKYIREDLKTLDLCVKAIKDCEVAYEYIPLHLKTPENNVLFLNSNCKLYNYLNLS
jgi:hypothetical protein